MSKRNKSFIWGGVIAGVLLIAGLLISINSSNFSVLGIFAVLGVLSFTLVSCLILDNNFVCGMIAEVFSWGFVQMPGLIFTLDLDGIIWLLTVKLLFWIIGIILAVICGVLAIALGLVMSVFVYPFALRKNIVYGEQRCD